MSQGSAITRICSSIFARLSAGLIIFSASFPICVQAETLQDALVTVYNSNPRLMAERARLREIDENYVQASAQGRLTSSIAGSLGAAVLRSPGFGAIGQPAGGSQTTTSEPASVQLQLIQPLYQGGRVKALKSQAKAGILAAREGLRQTELNLFLDVATAYSSVLRDEETARIRRNSVRVLARQMQAASDRFDVGVGSRTDIAQARARLAAADSGLAQADAQLQVSRAAYQRFVGRMPQQLKPLPKFETPKTLENAIRLGRDNNPAVIAALLNEKAAQASIDVAKSASKPVVSLNGTAAANRGQLSGISRAETGSITAQISIPIFSGGINKSRVRAAKEARTRLKFEARDTERVIDQSLTQIWAQLEAAKRSLSASQTQVEASVFAFEGVELEQSLGTRSALDVLNAEQELLEARLSVINANAAVQQAEMRLLTAIGAFDAASLAVPVDNYDPNENFVAIKDQGRLAIDPYLPERLRKSSP